MNGNISNNLPKHVAIVMDGNGRWAKQRGLPRIEGHQVGANAVHKAIEFSVQNQIQVVTLFALSIENRALRPVEEVEFLLSLFLESLQSNTNKLHKNNIQLRIVGDLSVFDQKLVEQIHHSEDLTKENAGLILNVAVNYSGRWDIVQATQKIALLVQQNKLQPLAIDEQTFQRYLCFSDVPEPDLLIRTSGEQRISNFMLWQFAYTEMYFPKILWPDFDENVYAEALAFFQSRQRRFGLTGEQIECQHA